MKRRKIYTILIPTMVLTLLAAGCSNEEPAPDAVPEGMVKVDFCQSGTFGAPLSDLKTRAGGTDIPVNPAPDGSGTLPYQPRPIEDGTTLWVAVYRGTPDDATNAEFVTVKSYRVSGSSMIPCKVKPDGTPEVGYDTPLFLPKGHYFFRALGPARELVRDESGAQTLSLYIENGEWLIANDLRYKETSGVGSAIELTEDNEDRLVPLDPLINQTARLKFTLYSAADDPFVHSLEMQPVGVEVSGLQDNYAKNENGTDTPWNWALCSPADTLIAYPGNKNTFIYLKEPLLSTDNRFVIETHVLPTDAMATPLIVLFNMKVNGNPTQFEMMINRKLFRAGYSYHYRGKVTIDDGVAALDWESVSWNADIPFFPKK